MEKYLLPEQICFCLPLVVITQNYRKYIKSGVGVHLFSSNLCVVACVWFQCVCMSVVSLHAHTLTHSSRLSHSVAALQGRALRMNDHASSNSPHTHHHRESPHPTNTHACTHTHTHTHREIKRNTKVITVVVFIPRT